MDNQELIEKLKAIMQKHEWSQERLAHELRVSFATVNRWFRLKHKIGEKTAFWIKKIIEERRL